MDAMRGERFNIDMDSDDEDNETNSPQRVPTMPMLDLIKDIEERAPAAPKPPAPPTPKATPGGFPAHKRRDRTSAFKQKRQKENEPSQPASAPAPPVQPAVPKDTPADLSLSLEERQEREIDAENQRKMEEMSPEDIEREREELMSGLPQSFLERMLKRSTIDDETPKNQPPISPSIAAPAKAPSEPSKVPKEKKRVAFAEPEEPIPESKQPPSLNQAIDSTTEASVHFPRPPQPADLDPSSPDFLENLHTKYFPSLSYDPKSLSWMSPIDPKNSSYNPAQSKVPITALRFDFHGDLIAPSESQKIPSNLGLHHHGEAPEAAGYTIPELAILVRSAVASQRCIAYQVLGRILHRLGNGQYGQDGGSQQLDPELMSEEEKEQQLENPATLATGLWDLVEKEMVVESIMEEATKETGHLSARTYAQEALWNYQRGGKRKRKAV